MSASVVIAEGGNRIPLTVEVAASPISHHQTDGNRIAGADSPRLCHTAVTAKSKKIAGRASLLADPEAAKLCNPRLL
jgi:hypothetical protein